MQQPLIIQHLFQVSSLEDVSRERLEAFVESYPSFGIGHYLLSRKLQSEGSDLFQPETQRTCLYFSNPLWLQWLLENEGVAVGSPATVEPMTVVPVWETTAPVWETAMPVVEETYVAAVSEVPVEETPVAHVDEPIAETPVAFREEPVEEAQAVTQEHTAEVSHEEPEVSHEEAEVSPEEPVVLPEEAEVPHEEPVGNVVTMAEEAFHEPAEGASAADELLRSIEEAKGIRESLHKLNDDFTAEEPVIHEEQTPHEELTSNEAPIQDEEAPFVLDEPAEPAQEETSQPEASSAEKIAAAVERVTAAIEPITTTTTTPAPTPTVTQDFLFEPYHTIDYFASQGIKLTLEDNPPDKLGKQLKSFTEWLKVMRRLPQKDREVVPDRVIEETIQTIAAHSIEGKDVLTETMAEVLAKQGMREKARAVYEKLSLLNPDKRAYFASKIEQLNIP